MIVAVIGKGGVGKTTIASLILRRLLESGETPVLAIDADPSNCLGHALGIADGRTLADTREELRDGAGRPPSMSSAEWFALQAEDAMVENAGFDLLTMGRPEGKGCYCFVNNLIRDHLDRLGRSYRHILMDCEAGLEHLSRRTAGRPDVLVCVANRSRMAAETVRRSLDLYRDLHGGPPPRADLVLNQCAAGQADVAGVSFRQVLRVPPDPQVAELDSTGGSLLNLGPASPAVAALAAWEVRG
jgi:CO dehydrogenase maturation factor